MSPRCQFQVLDRVENLIDREKGSWDADLVKSNFVAHEAEIILSIPISSTLPEDSRVWAGTRNGFFTVRSAYEVAFNLIKEGKKQVALGESSDRSKMKFFGSLFGSWSARISCGLCGLRETSGHALWGCKFASEVWKNGGLPTRVRDQLRYSNEFIDVVWRLKEDKCIQDWEWYAITAWKIWNNRNSFKHEGLCKQPKQIAVEARNYTEECRQSDPTPKGIQVRTKTCWQPPRAGWYKVNVDGAIFKDASCCGVGVVIRNEKEIEAKAMEEGIQLAKDLSLKEIIIEGDAKQVVMAISDSSSAPSSIKKVIEGMRLCLLHFNYWTASHVGRNGNMVAHQLAKHALFEDECTVWVEDTPLFVSNQVLMDVISMDNCPNQ
ncbi:uncharacterized protein LOC126728897 [Quercus robur]|uniref:uncharacterized protein LOC126728897 n=1 Tax=Quercus robur TaxID=38942 RepID=UPI002163AD69|nr:uncharacterized protein LOC126728897 [Quercus robur]